eukprot:c29382_g2_i3 orf=380-658(-)
MFWSHTVETFQHGVVQKCQFSRTKRLKIKCPSTWQNMVTTTLAPVSENVVHYFTGCTIRDSQTGTAPLPVLILFHQRPPPSTFFYLFILIKK